MRQTRQILRLHYEAGLKYAEIAASLGLSKSTVGKCVLFARAAGVDWAAAQSLADDELQARLYRPAVGRADRAPAEPDYAWIHQELKRTGVTLQLLWEEYQRGLRALGKPAYKYTSFCVKYRHWARSLKRSMRHTHIAGERLFIDYAGPTVAIIDAATGEISRAQIFVAVLGASNYTYACATATQTSADWVRSLIAALEFIGGVTRLIVPDQTRALIARPDRYEPQINRLVEEFCAHYGTVVLPARPAKPKDKPKVEVAVQVVERWILARLRNLRFFSLAELNAAIVPLLRELNARPFKKLPGCRQSAFATLEQPALQPLPERPMAICRYKSARVNIDYHVELDGHYYSVPHSLARQSVDLRISATTVEIFAGAQPVAIHPLGKRRGTHTTVAEHMPAAHRAHREWSPAKLITWGERIGKSTGELVRWQLEHRPHPEQGYRTCLGLMRLAREYSDTRLESACARALAIHSPSYRSVRSILMNHLDRQTLAESAAPQGVLPLHDNVRGSTYYH